MTDIDEQAAWDGVADAWDSHADYVDAGSARLTEALVASVGARAGNRVLELACGPGSLGATWSGLVGPTGRVVLSDLAPAMVAAAARRTAVHANVEVLELDLSAIDRPDASFDAVVCRMGLMFTPDPTAALREIHRVLAPGGRLAAATWAGPEHNPWMTSVGIAAMMHGLVGGGPPVGPGQIFSLGSPEVLGGAARAAGFADVAVDELPVEFLAATIDEHIARVSSLAGPMAAAFRAATPEQLAAVRDTAAQLAAAHASAKGLSFPGRALLLTATARRSSS